MNLKKFDLEVERFFGGIFDSAGFTYESAVFYREVQGGIYHLVCFDMLSSGSYFDVKVFASAKAIEPNIESLNPHDIGIPSDSFCCLSESGIGIDQVLFACGSDEAFQKSSSRVLELANSIAIPYLDGKTDLKRLLPHIRNPLYLAFAKGVLGEKGARELMVVQLERLEGINSDDSKVKCALEYLKQLLAS